MSGEKADGAIDGASAVREEDAFDLDAVRTWLVAEAGLELGPDVDVQQFGGGASNLTYSLRDGQHDLIQIASQKNKSAFVFEELVPLLLEKGLLTVKSKTTDQ